MDLTVGTKVYFVERTHPSWRYPHAVGHCHERRKALHAARPRVRVRFENYLSLDLVEHPTARVSAP
jgi:hypothetical protein